MEGTQWGVQLRARRGQTVLDRVAGDLLGVDVPEVPRVRQDTGRAGGTAIAGDGPVRDVVAERDRIRTAVRWAHRRRARRRRFLSRIG